MHSEQLLFGSAYTATSYHDILTVVLKSGDQSDEYLTIILRIVNTSAIPLPGRGITPHPRRKVTNESGHAIESVTGMDIKKKSIHVQILLDKSWTRLGFVISIAFYNQIGLCIWV